jgi:hypothetical protein
MRPAVLLILLGALCSAQANGALDRRVIAAAKQVYVDKLDVQLPHVRFEAWLQKQIGGVPIAWESNDCGEQDGFTGRVDIPLCGQASATLPDGHKITVMIGVGTSRKGVQGAPGVWFLSVQEKTSAHLSDLPKFLRTEK